MSETGHAPAVPDKKDLYTERTVGSPGDTTVATPQPHHQPGSRTVCRSDIELHGLSWGYATW
jgi:hypothetical protein